MNPRMKAVLVLLALASFSALFKGRRFEVLYWLELGAIVPAVLAGGRGRRGV